MKKLYTILLAALVFTGANAQSFMEDFESIATAMPAGWDSIQRSSNRDAASTSWFPGSIFTAPPPFPIGYSGSDCIAANWANSSTTASGTISNWLIAPVRMLNNGDKLIFNTSAPAGSTYPDRMQVRLSQMGASTNVGVDETTVGDFSTLVLDINPTYLVTGTPGGYPDTWTRFELVLSGLPAFPGVSGRLAFRYYVENAGWTGANSDAIGIDSVYYKDLASGIEETNISSTIAMYPNPAKDFVNLNFGAANTLERTVTITDVIGKVVFEQVFAENSISIDLTNLNAGAYMVTTTSDEGVGRKKLIVE